MHDSGRNLRPQNLALIPPAMSLTPIGLEALALQIFRNQMDRDSPKTGAYPGLKPCKITLKEIKCNIYTFQLPNSHTAKLQLNGSHTQSTQPSIHTWKNFKWITSFVYKWSQPNRWSAHMALQSDSYEMQYRTLRTWNKYNSIITYYISWIAKTTKYTYTALQSYVKLQRVT